MKKDNLLYELRVYFANPGMLDKLVSRFEHHTFHFFAKHKMQVVGLWLPLNNSENKLIYILSFRDQKAYEKSWEDFKNDPEWIAIKEQSSRDGELVASMKTMIMHTFDFSPDHLTLGEHHLFELQTYKIAPNNLELLRPMLGQRDVRLFQKNQVSIIKYWEAAEQGGDKSNLLICLLVHRIQKEGQEADKTGNIFLPGLVTSEYLQAMSFSPLK
jgi:hypothetical protein